MKVLLIDRDGDALDWAYRINECGHEVRHFILDTPRTCHIAAGLVPVVRDFRSHLDWADLIICCGNTHYLREIDAYRQARPYARIVGGTQRTCAWETDRETGCEVLNSCGIDTIPFQIFDSYDAAKRFARKRDTRLVSKPCGDADKAMSYVAGGPDPVEDLCYMLDKWQQGGSIKGRFMLQDFVEGVEMGADGWFGPHGWDYGWSESFEFKKVMAGDYGVNCGEMGTVVRFVETSKLADMVLVPLTEKLLEERYVGYVSLNCIIDNKGNPWPLEFTIGRPGFPTCNLEQEIHSNQDPAERLMMLASGIDAHSVRLDQISGGFVVAGKDYPHSRTLIKEVDGLPVFGCESISERHLHLAQMQKGDGLTEFATAGDYICVVTGHASTVALACENAKADVDELHVPGGVCVRDDIGERLQKQLPKLQKFGFAKGMEYE